MYNHSARMYVRYTLVVFYSHAMQKVYMDRTILLTHSRVRGGTAGGPKNADIDILRRE